MTKKKSGRLKNLSWSKVEFETEKDRMKGVYEIFDSGIKCENIGNKQYIVTSDHLALFENKGIEYKIVK